MIELKTLDKTFQMIHASDHITATIPDGMVFGLIGSNGAGKSTLLRMISGILKPDEGEVLIDGESVFENPSVKSQICFLSDTPYFFPNADIQQMRNYYMLCYPSFNRKLFDSLTDRFNLDPKRKISSFSKGMKKQVSILLGLCSGTKYLLCDETFDGLDPVVRQAVKSLFAAEILNRDFTPIISSHNLRELEDFCDSIGLLHQGQLLLTQSLDQIKCSVCKLQCVISDPHKEQQFLSSIKILKMERSGSLLTLTLRGSHSDILSAVQTYDPVFAEVLPLTLEEIFISETYRKELFPIFHVEKENVSSVSLQDIYITPEELLLTAEQRTELLSAYEKDVLNTDIRKLGSEVPIGEFSLTIRHVPNKETNTNQPFHSWVNGTREWNAAVNTAFPVTSSEDETNYKTFSIGSLYIYEDYENTLSCLEKYGYKIKRLIRAEDIDSVTLYLSGDSMKNKKWNDLLASFSSAKDENNSDPDKAAYEQSDEKDATSMFTITAPEDFRLLAEHLYLNPSDFLDRGGTSRDYAEVTFKKENNTFTYLLK